LIVPGNLGEMSSMIASALQIEGPEDGEGRLSAEWDQ
jgi:hypothetical protein